MADYRNLAIQLIAANGKIKTGEIKLLRKVLFAERKITLEEVEFLYELRRSLLKKSKKTGSAFDRFYLNCLNSSFLGNGAISAEVVGQIQKHLVEDKTIKASTKKNFLDSLKKKAASVAPGFDKLYSVIKK